MIKSFFLKRSCQIQLREFQQFLELSVGVAGEIDPQSGMILNLSILDHWIQEFRTQIQERKFQNLIEFLNTAKIFFQSKHPDLFAVQIDWQQGTALPLSLRWQYESFHLAVKGSLSTADQFQISFVIQNAGEFEAVLDKYFKNQNFFTSTKDAADYFKNTAAISSIKTENPILQQAFVENWD